MRNKIKKFVKSHTKEVIIFGVFIIAIIIYFIAPAFATLIPVKSVVITSENTSYKDSEPGSWQVTKSGKWTGKGEATVSFDVDTVLKSDYQYTDIIVVLDTSDSMSRDKIARVKSDSIDLINTLLSNPNNRAALITFGTTSTIISDLTNDAESLTNQINELTTIGTTNYYQALVNVDAILQNYNKEDNREVVVLFLTDGCPNEGTPNQISQYKYLKKQYPYITINGIQYEMGDVILQPIEQISDNQYFADMETLNNVLFDASVAPISYDTYQIVDYVENDYFYLEDESDITISEGKVELSEENGKQKITWTITDFRSGSDAKLSMKLKLKDELIGKGGIYPTNDSEEIISKIKDTPDENVSSTLTPVLEDDYKVIYDGNNPAGCSVSNVPEATNYSVNDTVAISQEEPSCEGYEFKRWEIVTDNVTKVNDDYFIMPESDVTIRAIWTKTELAKSMDGTVYSAPNFYDVIASQSVMDNTSSEYVNSSSGIDFSQISSDTNGKGVYERAGTEDDDYPVYYYRGDIDNNHVKFAGFCWKAVRTTSTGGVKLIYDGKPDANGACNNSGADSQIGTSKFNENVSDIGYMYGNLYLKEPTTYNSAVGYLYSTDVSYNNGFYTLTGSPYTATTTPTAPNGYYTCLSSSGTCRQVYYVINSTYLTTFNGYLFTDGASMKNSDFITSTRLTSSNSNNSTVKSYIDSWYSNNMKNYTDYLEDTVWCNDRSVSTYLGSNGTIYDLEFNTYNRTNPNLICEYAEDSFTVNNENGNGKLTFPVGLLTTDEIMLAGRYTNNYLNTNENWWTMSPANVMIYRSTYNYVLAFNGTGYFSSLLGVRPTISLVPGIKVIGGDGTSSTPFEVDVDK